MRSIERILSNVSVFSVLVPLITGLISFKKLDLNSRIMMVLLTFASISQLAIFLPEGYRAAFYNSYFILDATVFGYLFYRNSESKRIRTSIVVIISLQVLVAIYTYATAGITKRFYTELVCSSNLLQVLWVLSFFYERYKREDIRALEKEPMFWFCLGILVYAPATYFRFAFLGEVKDTDYVLKSLHHLPNAGMYLIFTVGILANVIRTSKLRNVFIRNKS